jgi:hypothetical protein
MSDMTPEKAQALLDGATSGRRVQFHGSYCKEAEGTPFTDWDTSHEMSVIRTDGTRYRLAHYKHASDAYLSQMAPDLARAYIAQAAKLAEARDKALEEAAQWLDAQMLTEDELHQGYGFTVDYPAVAAAAIRNLKGTP